ncbi:MAG: class I SAM-dependent methyltransferase [Acidimicrobiales bacterium]|nr:class I SAM-dependent methyltransferase [Acidimicrobiales bacterium]
MTEPRWNSNLHALDLLLDEVPDGAHDGLDVGCGEGETARHLRARVPHVVGIDPDETSIELARAAGDDIDYRLAELHTADLGDSGFDVVTCVAMLHHVDQATGLTDLARLVRPGGILLVVGLARSRSVADYLRDAVDAVALRRHTLRTPVWETPSPKVWPPPLTYAQTKAVSLDALPTATFRRLSYFRYGLTWRP